MTYDDRNDRYEDEYQYRDYQDYQYEDDYGQYPADNRQWLLVRALRALSGTVAAGIVVLTLVIIGSAYLGGNRGFPGPGTTSITAHIAASVVALAAQIWCDRRRGIAAVAGSVVVLVVAGLLLVTQWWG
ncbi:hypothetical protein O4214_09720 [Rhodococcus erythropolis]|uniref:hypothetical protein n=1 Tax=Rhodococcus erythropolis TaxID=1833 RepID=UPI001E4DB05A|nr:MULTISPECIES: hypothetical protein [Rhodococcus erythropolis group]MCD2108938.1 hypothetical protein [Rhodococcus qingshengii]MCZ4524254.1 hypothetical protein [Rhodococcus erythropolis]